MVETRYFTITPGRYIRTAIWVWLGQYGWIGALVLAGFAAAGFMDSRFFIVAAALALIAYPGIMMLVYFNHALTKEAAYCVIPHRVRIDESGIGIDYLHQDDHPTPPSQSIAMDDIDNSEDTGAYLKLTLKSGKHDIIEIPSEAFEGNDLAVALNHLTCTRRNQ